MNEERKQRLFNIAKEIWSDIPEENRRSLLSDFVTNHRNLRVCTLVNKIIAESTHQRPAQIKALPRDKFMKRLTSILDEDNAELVVFYEYLINKYVIWNYSEIATDLRSKLEEGFKYYSFVSEESKEGNEKILDISTEGITVEQDLDSETIEKVKETIKNAHIRAAKGLMKKYSDEDIRFVMKALALLTSYDFAEAAIIVADMDFEEIRENPIPNPENELTLSSRVKSLRAAFKLTFERTKDEILPLLEKYELPGNSISEILDSLEERFIALRQDIIENAHKSGIETEEETKILSLHELERIAELIEEQLFDSEEYERLNSFYGQFRSLKGKDELIGFSGFMKSLEEKLNLVESHRKDDEWINREAVAIKDPQHPYNLLLKIIKDEPLSKSELNICKKSFGRDFIDKILDEEVSFGEKDEIANSDLNPTTQVPPMADDMSDGNTSTTVYEETRSSKEIPKQGTIDESETKRRVTQTGNGDAIEIDSEENLKPDTTVMLVAGISDIENSLLKKVIENLSANNLSTSYLILKYLNDNNPLIKEEWPLWTVEALIYSRFLNSNDNEFSQQIGRLIESIDIRKKDNLSNELEVAINMLIFASMMKPALISPATDAARILSDVRFTDDFSYLNKLLMAIINFSSHRYPMSPELAESHTGVKELEFKRDMLREKLKQWIEKIRNVRVNYLPARQLLTKWISKEGLLFKIVNPILEDDPSNVAIAQSVLNTVDSEKAIHREIEKGLKELNQRNLEISGVASSVLLKSIQESKEFLKSWQKLLSVSPTSKDDYGKRLTEEMFAEWTTESQVISEKLSAIDHSDQPVQTGAKILLHTISSMDCYLQGNVESKSVYINPIDLLDIDLHSLPGSMANDLKYLLSSFVEKVSEDNAQVDWDSVVEEHCRQGQFESVDKIIEYFAFIGNDDKMLERWKQRRDVSLEKQKESFERLTSKLKDMVESAAMNMLINEREREDMNFHISQVSIAEISDFPSGTKILDRIKNEIEEKSLQQKEIFMNRLMSMTPSDELTKRVKESIERNEFANCSIILDALERGEEVFDLLNKPEEIYDFLKSIDGIEKYLSVFDNDRSKLCDLLEKMSPGSSNGPLMLPSKESEFEIARHALHSWFNVGRNWSEDSTGSIKGILGSLGWQVKSLKHISDNKPYKAFDLQTSESPYCPLPFLGSESNGAIRIYAIWGNYTTDLYSILKSLRGNRSVFLFFGRLSFQQRLDLLHFSIMERETFILVDDMLYSYLCSKSGLKLKTLYLLTFPFTFHKPYITAASILPSELFYGRREILEGLLNPTGQCIIYGGRQLGKTVILKKLEKDNKDSFSSFHVKYCDLKQKGMGEVITDTTKIWGVIAEALLDFEIITKKSEANDERKAYRVIEKYLSDNPSRRLLFLFDEADKFIELDSKNDFHTLRALSGLMRDTNGSVKFVLSGLHSVNRFSRSSNSSIAHLLARGSFIVGPMINNGEQREARNLILKPFTTLGFEFESEGVISDVLSLSNFYPSLIQLFCDKLLNHMYEKMKNRQSDLSNLPLKVTKNDIENVYYRKSRLREEIVERFEWTLNLDPRYEVIAYIIALRNRESSAFAGLRPDDIRKEANFWKGGLFERTSAEDQYEDILDEMVGLGILSKTDNGCYVLKNNVLALLGSSEQVEQKLLNISNDQYIETYYPEYMRSYSAEIPYKFSPLVNTQEGRLFEPVNTLIYVTGSKALLIEELKQYVGEACRNFDTDFVYCSTNEKNKREIEYIIERFLSKELDKQSLLFVDGESLPENDVLTDAIKHLRSKKTVKYFKKIVLAPCSDNLWSFIRHDPYALDDLKNKGLEFMELRKLDKIFIEKFFKERMVRLKIDDCIRNLGCWPFLYAKLIQSDPETEQPISYWTEYLNDPRERDSILKLFGIEVDEIRDVLGLISGVCFKSAEDFRELADSADHFDLIQSVIEWGQRTEMFDYKNGEFCVDSIVKNLVLD